MNSATNPMIAHFQMMARYNRPANERLYDCCARLSDSERKKNRQAFFKSIHRIRPRRAGARDARQRLGRILFCEAPVGGACVRSQQTRASRILPRSPN
jgi:hypothetical protein